MKESESFNCLNREQKDETRKRKKEAVDLPNQKRAQTRPIV